jgi:hypothetical protein
MLRRSDLSGTLSTTRAPAQGGSRQDPDSGLSDLGQGPPHPDPVWWLAQVSPAKSAGAIATPKQGSGTVPCSALHARPLPPRMREETLPQMSCAYTI